MHNPITISVVIPNYNRSDLLNLAIESVLHQTFLPIEILVCDDGSTDNSKEVVSAFNASIVKWIDCGKNGRPAIPRNIGIKKASGSWIAFLDNDDVWLPEKLEQQVKLIDNDNKVKAICTNAYRLRGGDFSEIYFKENVDCSYSFENLFYSNQIICSSVLVNKEVLEDLSLFPEGAEFKAIEDYALWLRISTKYDFYYINKPLLKYRDDLISDSIRKQYSTIEEIRKVLFPNLNEWLTEKNIILSSRSRIELDKRLCLIRNENRLGLFDKLRFKFRYKLNDLKK